MKLKSVVAAVVALVASAGTQAGGTIGSGDLAIPSTWTVGGFLSGSGTILDNWVFTTAEDSNASASATNTFVFSGGTTYNQISSFAATLDGHSLSLLTLPSQVIPGCCTLTTQNLSIAPFTIGTGTHHLVISGVVGSGGGSYSATLALAPAPVPEPETYALMLAGLGAIGFLARRRNSI